MAEAWWLARAKVNPEKGHCYKAGAGQKS